MPVGVRLGVGLQRYAPGFALKLLKSRRKVANHAGVGCKPEAPRFAPKSLNSRGYGANCNPYFYSDARGVGRFRPPHAKLPGRNHVTRKKPVIELAGPCVLSIFNRRSSFRSSI